jgi:hypothetical protein
MPIDSSVIVSRRLTQNLAVAAGSIIRPTANSEPIAWKAPTRLSTTSIRKMKCAQRPAPLTLRRKPGSRHSATSGRQISAMPRRLSVDVMPVTSSDSELRSRMWPNST